MGLLTKWRHSLIQRKLLLSSARWCQYWYRPRVPDHRLFWMFAFKFYFSFETDFSLYSSNWPQTPNPPVSASKCLCYHTWLWIFHILKIRMQCWLLCIFVLWSCVWGSQSMLKGCMATADTQGTSSMMSISKVMIVSSKRGSSGELMRKSQPWDRP